MRPTAVLTSLICLCAIAGPDPHAQTPPNILLIISDDHAWTDYGFMGHRTVKTPSIDRVRGELQIPEHFLRCCDPVRIVRA